MTTIKYATSGEQRKKLANALSEILGYESKYLKAPSYGYEVGSCIVNRAGDIEFPDDMTEEEIEAIVKKLPWYGFERILDESEEEIGDVPILEEPALETEDPTEEMADDATEANVEESEDVLDETVRLFLVSLNFKGLEYAFARKFLLRNLSGNSGWRTE